MSTSSWTCKLNKPQKETINLVFERVAEKNDLTKSETLVYIVDAFSKMQLGNTTNEPVTFNIRETLLDIDCDYIEYSDETFWCLEKTHKTKKKDELGTDPESVKRICRACKQGKADIIGNKIREERRKESFKRIERFLKQFMTITEKGFIAETYMCLCNAIEGNLIYSRDGKSLQCPLMDDDIVQIQDICMTALNPQTGLPPCKNLVTLEHLVQLTKEDIESMDIDLPQIDYMKPEEPTSHVLNKESRKNIEAEYEVQEEKDKLKAEKETDNEEE